MKKQKLFEYVIIKHPSDKEFEKGKRSEVIVGPNTIMADDLNTVNTIAAREIPAPLMKELDRVEVAARPF